MSGFWSAWISLLTAISIAGITWILFANRTTKGSGPDQTTGHVYDGIEEYDNPLPAWWFQLYVISILFSIGYLIAYPGMGNYKGLLNWTQVGQWQQRVDAAEKKYSALFAQYRDLPVIELASNKKALKMGQRMFANNCSQCHGGDARGTAGFPDLADSEWLYGGSPEQIKASITRGRNGMMPGWLAPLTEVGVSEVSQYVYSLSATSEALETLDAPAVAAGKGKFAMFCSACHGGDASGNVMLGAPDLSNDIWLYGGTLEHIAQSISGGRSGKMPAHGEVLSEDKIHLLSAYVYSLSLK